MLMNKIQLQMKVYAKSIVRIANMLQNKRVIHRKEINDDLQSYVVSQQTCDLGSQSAGQSDNLEDADSLAFLHELFGSKCVLQA
jgi:hypothetical protein